MNEYTEMNAANPNPGENTPRPPRAKSKWLWYTLISLGLIALVWFLLSKADIEWSEWWALATNPKDLRDFIDNYGTYGPLVCIAMQFIQVVIFFIPGEVTQMVAGLAFGAFWGFVYSVIGLILGSMFNFYLARKLGRPFVERIVDRKTIEKVDNFMNARKGRTAIALMFLLPGFPKDALCYIVGGITSLSYMRFFVISSIGRTPALLFSVIFGDKMVDGDYVVIAVLAGLVAAFTLLGWWWKRSTPRLESQ